MDRLAELCYTECKSVILGERMVLSAESRVLEGEDIELEPREGRAIAVIVRSDVTDGIFVTELEFPVDNVRFFLPRVGYLALRVGGQNDNRWLAPEPIVLSRQKVLVTPTELTLRAVALIPAPGCRMDVRTRYS